MTTLSPTETNSLSQRLQRLRIGVLRFLLRVTRSERQRLLVLTILIGAASGVAAVAFHVAIMRLESFLFGAAAAGSGVYWMLWMILVPTLGALLSGIALHYVVSEARGSGIPQVKAAYATPGGQISLRAAGGKFLIGVVQIGSGSSLGREGPTVQICAGIASFFGRMGSLSKPALRRMLPVGAAAAVAAAFNAPIAAVTFAIEEIVGDLDQAVLSGVIIAAALAAAIERSILGEHPAFEISQQYSLEHTSSLLLYALLGILAALLSIIFTDSLLALRRYFKQVHAVPRWAQPAIGGFVTGVLAVIGLKLADVGGILGGGYTTITAALSESLTLKAVLVLCILKLMATVAAYGSGGAGGIFAPALFLGAMLGASVGFLDQYIFGFAHEEVGAFALVGMGAVFAGSIRAPITSVLIIFEMTNAYSLILPLMIANMTSYLLARHWRPRPIYEALLEQDGIHIPHPGRADPLARVPVAAFMTTKAVTLDSDMNVSEALERVSAHEFNTYPVVQKNGAFVGFVSEPRLRRAAARGEKDLPVTGFVTRSDHVFPDTPLIRAVVRLNKLGVHLLAVVERTETRKFIGLLTSSDVVRAQAAAAPDFDETATRTLPGVR